MDDTLKRLLDAEHRAEETVREAKANRETITRKALEEAHHTEQQFNTRIPEIHASFLGKSEARASRTITELQHRYDERNRELHRMAEEHEGEAIQAALALLTDPEMG
ncbi:MAG: ATPase [Gammaproteobacteria bacterium]|nr:ATPase [Gammaproteobacteria bacterium]